MGFRLRKHRITPVNNKVQASIKEVKPKKFKKTKSILKSSASVENV